MVSTVWQTTSRAQILSVPMGSPEPAVPFLVVRLSRYHLPELECHLHWVAEFLRQLRRGLSHDDMTFELQQAI
jgi:hypothetical protein